MTGGVVRIAVACEDDRHFVVVSRLLDDEAIRQHGWLDGVIESVRQWVPSEDRSRPYRKLKDDDARFTSPVHRLPDGTEIRRRGFIAGEPRQAEANQWSEVLLKLIEDGTGPALVVLVRDLDGSPERRHGMLQVVEGLPWPPSMRIMVATPEPEMEAWVVSGFAPENERETRILADLKRRLSFDPTTQSDRLTSHPNTADSDAKRVLRELTGGNPDRELRCLADTVRLETRGIGNHCADFIQASRVAVLAIFRR